ncbi:MAG: protein kinase [Candidatus Aminicenantes bacterium]|jgi:serine/threonine protein kinase/Tfp pilus assembly protein PilF
MKCPKCDFDNTDESRFCSHCGTQFETSEDISEVPTITRQTPFEDFTPGSTFAARYQIIEELGIGGMGTVYKAMDTTINEKVALKLIKPEIASNKSTIERFQNELKYARKVSHKNVCRMYHLSKDNDSHYIVMEYVPGENLKSMIRMTKQLSVNSAVNIARQVCEGLAEAHRLGVVHRDLKPSNIMIDREGTARIMDFGIARSLETDGLTGPGLMVGTPEYMSPEQAEGKRADQRSDIYSLGIILFEMVAGKVPFEGKTPISVALKHKKEIPQNPRKINNQVPESLSSTILKCLEKKKEKRFQSAEELLEELTRIEKRLPTTENKLPKRKPITSREITVRFNLKKLFLPAFVLIAAISLGTLGWKFLSKEAVAVPLEDMARVAVITFQNQTGDSNYDYLQEAIPNLLITSLEQNRYIRVTTWERLRDLLKQMGKEDVRIIDRDLGFELCREEEVDAIVLGSFVKAEETFATDVKVFDVETKNLIKSTSSRGEGVDSILNKQIDELSREISRGIGLSERKSRPPKVQIADVTTNSMEAYNYFLRGRDDFEKFYYSDARRFLEKAVELDPEFALAHLYLARTYGTLGEKEKWDESIKKFKKYGKKVTGKEGMYVKAILASMDEKGKNDEIYFEILQEMAKRYPEEKRVHFDLGVYYMKIKKNDEAEAELKRAIELDPEYGYALNQLAYLYSYQNDFEKALEYFHRYASVSPGDANPFDSMGEMYFRMGKLDASIEKFKEAMEVKPDFPSSCKISYIYALKEDYEEAFKWVDHYISNAQSVQWESVGHQLKGFYHYIRGDLDQAFQEIDRSIELATQIKDISLIDIAYRLKIWICYEWDKIGLFRKYFKERMDFRIKNSIDDEALNSVISNFYQGLLDLKLGKIESAKSNLAAMQSTFSDSESDIVKKLEQSTHDYLHGLILLEEGAADEAISIFENMPPRYVSFNNLVTFMRRNLPFDDDLHALAFLKKGEIEKAISEYEKITSLNLEIGLDRPLIHPLSRYRLARLYEETGQREKAIDQYEKALTIWSNGEESLFEMKDARKKLKSLKADTSKQ